MPPLTAYKLWLFTVLCALVVTLATLLHHISCCFIIIVTNIIVVVSIMQWLWKYTYRSNVVVLVTV